MSSRHGLEIRAATSADAPGLCTLISAAGQQAEPRTLAERLDALRLEPGAVLVALEWGPPSGLIMLHWYRTLDAQPIAQITMLLVGLEQRRRGIGRLLVKAAAQTARAAGCGTLELLVPLDQPTIATFCRVSGFNEAGHRFVRGLRKKN